MVEAIFAYINEHTWAQWAFAGFLFVPPLLLGWNRHGLASLDVVLSWFALLILLALALA